MSIPRTLLITHYPVGTRNGSTQQLKPILGRYQDRIVWYSTKPPITAVSPPVPYQHGRLLTRPSRRPFSHLRNYLNWFVYAYKLGFDAARFGRANEVEVVWAGLSLEAVIAARVAAAMQRIPLAAYIPDDSPSLLKINKNIPEWIIRRFIEEFDRSMKTAKIIAVISDYMAEMYSVAYRKECVTLFLGVESRMDLPTTAAINPNEFRIGSIGSIVSSENWNILLDAVRLINSNNSTQKVTVLHIGETRQNANTAGVEVTGWIEGDDFYKNLSRFDLGYLSLWFEPEYKILAQTSLPTKIHSFIAAQKPLIAFGPEYSSIVKFVNDHQCGIACAQRDISSLAQVIDLLRLDSQRYMYCQKQFGSLLDKYSLENYLNHFEHFLSSAISRSYSPISLLT